MKPHVVTMKEVAIKAEVSVFVVSKVLNDGWRQEHIREAVVARVRDAMRSLNYVPNHSARALRTGRTGSIGLVLPFDKRLDRPELSSALIGSVEVQSSECGQDLMLLGRGLDENEVDRAIDRLRTGRIDALIIPGTLGCIPASRSFSTATGPIVIVFPVTQTCHSDIGLDAAPGIAEAVKHLVGLGHRRIGWLAPSESGSNPATSISVRDRRAALSIAARLHRVEVVEECIAITPEIRPGQWIELARRHGAGYVRSDRVPSAVMCYNDSLAIGLCQAAFDHGVRIPKDLSVIGFDDLAAESAIPPLTTISHAFPEIGRRAVLLALDCLHNPDAPARRERLPAPLVIRETTAPCAQR